MAPDFSVVSDMTLDKSPFSFSNPEIGPQALKAFLVERAQLQELVLTLLDPVFCPHVDLLSTRLLLHPGSAHSRYVLGVFENRRQPAQTLAGDGQIHCAAIKRRMS